MNVNDLLPAQVSEFDDRLDPQLQAAAEIAEIARHLDLEDWISQRLLHTEREVSTNLLLPQGGHCETVAGYRVQHVSVRKPTLGTVNFSAAAYLSEVRAAAMEATWQSMLLNLPFGGAAGAVICAPETRSENDLRQLAKGYGRALRGMVGRDIDVIAPGHGCNSQIMAWIADGASQDGRAFDPAAVVGKPEAMYGMTGESELNARGVVVLLKALLERKGLDLRGLRVAILGFGPSECPLLGQLDNSGARIVAVADSSGGVLNANGIDVEALHSHAVRNSFVLGLNGAEAVSNADVVECECDVLIIAGRERQMQITLPVAEHVRARIVIELCSGAISNAAEELMTFQGRAVVPALLGNAGSAIGAFVEWKKSSEFAVSHHGEMELELSTRITSAVNAVVDAVASAAEQKRVTLRRAAKTLAIDRIAREMRARN